LLGSTVDIGKISNLEITELDENGTKIKVLWFMKETCGETFTTPAGQDYRGKQNKTRSGKTCQGWNAQTPHVQTYGVLQNYGLGDHNYCRNPTESGKNTIWCYTTDPASPWEFCDPLLI